VTSLCLLQINVTLQVWSKKLRDGSTAAVAFNRGSTPMNVTITAEMLSPDLAVGGGDAEAASAAAGKQVRDLWRHEDMGAFGRSGYTAIVGAHDVVAIRVGQQ
jgi:hypothetical protein